MFLDVGKPDTRYRFILFNATFVPPKHVYIILFLSQLFISFVHNLQCNASLTYKRSPENKVYLPYAVEDEVELNENAAHR